MGGAGRCDQSRGVRSVRRGHADRPWGRIRHPGPASHRHAHRVTPSRAQELSWIGEASMNRQELFASIVAACPGRDDTVYLERRGDSYSWRIMPDDAVVTETPSDNP